MYILLFFHQHYLHSSRLLTYICTYVCWVCHSYPFFTLIQFVCQLTYYFCSACGACQGFSTFGERRQRTQFVCADTFRQTDCFRIENVFVRTSVVRHMFDVSEYQPAYVVWYVTSQKKKIVYSKLANQKNEIFLCNSCLFVWVQPHFHCAS